MGDDPACRGRVLVVSNIAWNFVWQRHQSLAALFAREHDVVFCEIPGVRRVRLSDAGRILSRLRTTTVRPNTESLPSRLRLVRPFVLPATNPLFHGLNRILVNRLVRRTPDLRRGVDWILDYSPSRTALALIARVPHRHLIYDCTDDWLAVRRIPSCLAGDEKSLLQQADLTLVPSDELERRKRADAKQIVRLPHGAFVERFAVPPRQRRSGDPFTVLYYGHIHAQHLDVAAIDALALARPEWRVVLVGPVKTPHRFPGNVTLPGQVPHERLRDFVLEADVVILPYALNAYTQAVMPAKTYECLAAGRPIVATPLPQLVAEFAPYIRFVARRSDWAPAIEDAYATDTEGARNAKIAFAQANSWEARFETIMRHLRALDAPDGIA